ASRSTASSPRRSAGSSRSGVFTVREAGLHSAGPTRQGSDSTLTSLEQARRIAALAREKLAEDVVILDMRPVCDYTDYFVVATGRNPRQTVGIWDEVHGRLKHELELLPRSIDGAQEGTWILADY